MTKNHTEQTGSNLLAHPGRTSDSSPKNTVSKQMSLSDSILSGAVVSYRKAGYTFGHTYILILRFIEFFPENVIWIFNQKPCIVQKVTLL